MKVKKFHELNEADTNQIPDTQLHKYLQFYKMWCDENDIEYHFADAKGEKLREIINIGKKYAEEHNLPNILYYKDS
jgi:predicted HAD superfamily Cof-like phosphohydrolase